MPSTPSISSVSYSTSYFSSLDSNRYKYGFNTQEKDDEIAGDGNINTALFWEYDTRLGRRWNIDLEITPYLSNYSVMGNNPVINTDYFGDKFNVTGTKEERKQIKAFIKEARKKSQTFNELYKDLKNSKKIYELKLDDAKEIKKDQFTPSSTGGVLTLSNTQVNNFSISNFGSSLGEAWISDRGLFPFRLKTDIWNQGKQGEADAYNGSLESKIAKAKALGNIQNLISADLGQSIRKTLDFDKAVVVKSGTLENPIEKIEFEPLLVIINDKNYDYFSKKATIHNFFNLGALKFNGKPKKKIR